MTCLPISFQKREFLFLSDLAAAAPHERNKRLYCILEFYLSFSPPCSLTGLKDRTNAMKCTHGAMSGEGLAHTLSCPLASVSRRLGEPQHTSASKLQSWLKRQKQS